MARKVPFTGLVGDHRLPMPKLCVAKFTDTASVQLQSLMVSQNRPHRQLERRACRSVASRPFYHFSPSNYCRDGLLGTQSFGKCLSMLVYVVQTRPFPRQQSREQLPGHIHGVRDGRIVGVGVMTEEARDTRGCCCRPLYHMPTRGYQQVISDSDSLHRLQEFVESPLHHLLVRLPRHVSHEDREVERAAPSTDNLMASQRVAIPTYYKCSCPCLECPASNAGILQFPVALLFVWSVRARLALSSWLLSHASASDAGFILQ